MYQRMRRVLLIIALLLLVGSCLAAQSLVALPALAALRWLVLAGLCVYACFRPSLTTWIFISMLLGQRSATTSPHSASARTGTNLSAVDQSHHCAAAVLLSQRH
jgi:hypothetical protein